MLTSSPTIPEVVFERIKSDITELAFNFFQDGVSFDVAAKQYKIRLKASGIQALEKTPATNAAGRVTFVLSNADKTPLNGSEYQISLVELITGGERTIVTGTLRWSVPTGKTIGLVVAPDVSVNYIAATGSLMVALGVVDFGSSSSALSAAAAAGSAVLAGNEAGVAEDFADAAIAAKNATEQIKTEVNALKADTTSLKNSTADFALAASASKLATDNNLILVQQLISQGFNVKGNWDIPANSPNLGTISKVNGDAYVVLVPGTTTITGTSIPAIKGDVFHWNATDSKWVYRPNATAISDGSVSTQKTTFIGISKNLFNKLAVTEGSAVNNTGAIQTQAGYAISEKIDVIASTNYTLSGTIASPAFIKIRFEDATGTLLGVYNANSANFTALPATFTTPANCKKIIFNAKTANVGNYDNVQLEAGSLATPYESYKFLLNLPLLGLPANSVLRESVVDRAISALKTNFIIPGKNKINKDAIVEGYQVETSGFIGVNALYSICKCEVRPLTTYTLSGILANPSLVRIRFEDSTGTFLGVYNGTPIVSTSLPSTFTTPDLCTRIIVNTKCGGTSDYTTLQLEAGVSPSAFEAYKLSLDISYSNLLSSLSKSEVDFILNKFSIKGKNLIDKTKIIEGLTLDNTGRILSLANYSMTLVNVLPEMQYTFSGTIGTPSSIKMRFEKADGTFISVYNANAANFSTLPASFTTPALCTRVWISTKINNVVSSYDLIQLELGAVATPFEAFKLTMPASNIDLSAYSTTSQADVLYAKLNVPSKNLLNKGLIIEGTGIANTSGAIVTQAGYAICPVAVLPLTQYTYSGTMANASFVKVRFESALGTYLGMYNSASSNFSALPASFSTPADCTKLYITVKAGSTSNYDTIQLEAGSSATSYAAYGGKLSGEQVELSAYYSKAAADTIFVKPSIASKNLINKYNIIEGQAVNNTGALQSQAGYAITEKITVLPLTSYTLSGTIQNPQFVKIRYEDSTGALLGVYNANSANFSTLPATFTTPALCVKIVINVKVAGTSNYDTVQLELGTVATGYTSGITKINSELLDLSAINLSGYVSKASFLTWLGKKFVFFGDSITAQGYYIPFVQAVHGFTWVSNGVSGSCIATGKEDIEPDGVHRTALVTRVPDVTATASDVIFIFAGTNDWYYNVPIGIATDTITSTFYGALKNLLSSLQAQNAGKTIVICTPLQRNNNRTNYTTQKVYADTIKEVAAMYSVPVLDLFNGSGITYENIGQFTSDNVHPTSTVGAPYIARKMSAFLFRI